MLKIKFLILSVFIIFTKNVSGFNVTNKTHQDLKILVFDKFGSYYNEYIKKNKTIEINNTTDYIASYDAFQIPYFLTIEINSYIIKDTFINYKNKMVEVPFVVDSSYKLVEYYRLMLNQAYLNVLNHNDLIFKLMDLIDKREFLEGFNTIKRNYEQKKSYIEKTTNNDTHFFNLLITNKLRKHLENKYYFNLIFNMFHILKLSDSNNVFLKLLEKEITLLNNNINLDSYQKARITSYYFNEKYRRNDKIWYEKMFNLEVNNDIKWYCNWLLLRYNIKKHKTFDTAFRDMYEKLKSNQPIDSDYMVYLDNLIEANKNINLLPNNLLQKLNKDTIQFNKLIQESKKLKLIDFWASWCVPCRAEMPASKKIIDKYKNKLDYIFISIDEDESRWKNAVKSEQLQQYMHSYIMFNFDKSDINNKYKIYTIPRFLLFDKNGKLIADDAPRPSNPKLIELIDKNL